jgi:hypothetical protein
MAETTEINLKIDAEFRDLLRPLTTEEYENLEESIKELGMAYDPILHWEGVIIDGHHRHNICEHGGYDYDIVGLEFDTREEAKQWILDKQIGRRNLTPTEIKYYRGLRYTKASEGYKSGSHNGFAKQLVEEENVSVKTLQRNAEFAKSLQQADNEVRDKVLKEFVKPTNKELKEIVKMAPKDQKKAIESIEQGVGIEYEDVGDWVIELAEPYKQCVSQLRSVKKKLETIAYNPTEGKYLASKHTRIKNNLDELIDAVHQCEPVSGCNDCGGEGCNNCYGTGFLSRAAKESQDK